MGLFDTVDAGITRLVGQWNLYTTTLATIFVVLVSYRVISSRDPDVHPMLLARQAVPSTVRNEGESAVYRSQAAPHGMPLNSGLNVKDPGASKWSRGRDGDLRDVWRKVIEGGENGAKGRLLTVLGSEKVIEHKLEDITRQINLIGQHFTENKAARVAVYLPNSIELLATLFAAAFCPNVTTVLIPFDTSEDNLISMLRQAEVDTVITASGSFPLDNVTKSYPALRQLIWVVDEGSKHLDWNEVPEGVGSAVNVATWQDIVHDAPAAAGLELPATDATTTPGDIITFWQNSQTSQAQMARFTQANIVAGVAAQLAALPHRERLNAADLFLPADSMVHSHTLVVTLAALYSNASVAFNSVAEQSSDVALATQGVVPTILVASPETLLRTHGESAGKLTSALASASHALSTRSLTQEGIFNTSNLLSPFSSGARPAIGTTPGKLRLVYVAERAGASTPALSSRVVSDLRIFTGARVIYALTAAPVAGSVSQTAFFDYRLDAENGKAHFGGPVTSVEVWLKDTDVNKTTDDKVEGEINVRGPSVAGGEASLGVVGRINEDHTVAYA
ncbi:uncharacterized protein J7T54_002201 [Emericellopsis cladophorae]|uniref:AMP-dependent synthetase/ligase domain-containing protein n=1 Tax=Emericellopsis cladophorae TaxID=2686198 RepID=A0A9P9Y3V3_9HYPO|nr:uncharacterized protein J7T54_002201 [Emericellopsis cladophorae]KAI6783039.1 hypothetical protein J7T54_002201 [Emericellopsis cladophorae]